MSPCLSPEELVDAAERQLDPARAAHLVQCARCRQAAVGLQAMLEELAPVDVPEPSPMVWATMRRGIRQTIAADRAAPRGWAGFGWPTLVPLTGLAVLLLSLSGAFDRAPTPGSAERRPAAGEPVATDAPGAPDDALALVLALSYTLPPDQADLIGPIRLPDLGEVAAATLTGDELRALEALLREAVDRPES